MAMSHSRQKYGILDLMGDLGGVAQVVISVMGFFLFPFSEHNFVIKALQKMYNVRTKNDKIF